MQPQISLKSAFVAVMLFAVAVAMHEAARADSLMSQGYHPMTQGFVTRHGKKPLGLKGSGGTSRIQENCTYGNDGITRCDDCDVDWDQNPPAKFCLTAAICYDNNGKKIACP